MSHYHAPAGGLIALVTGVPSAASATRARLNRKRRASQAVSPAPSKGSSGAASRRSRAPARSRDGGSSGNAEESGSSSSWRASEYRSESATPSTGPGTPSRTTTGEGGVPYVSTARRSAGRATRRRLASACSPSGVPAGLALAGNAHAAAAAAAMLQAAAVAGVVAGAASSSSAAAAHDGCALAATGMTGPERCAYRPPSNPDRGPSGDGDPLLRRVHRPLDGQDLAAMGLPAGSARSGLALAGLRAYLEGPARRCRGSATTDAPLNAPLPAPRSGSVAGFAPTRDAPVLSQPPGRATRARPSHRAPAAQPAAQAQPTSSSSSSSCQAPDTAAVAATSRAAAPGPVVAHPLPPALSAFDSPAADSLGLDDPHDLSLAPALARQLSRLSLGSDGDDGQGHGIVRPADFAAAACGFGSPAPVTPAFGLGHMDHGGRHASGNREACQQAAASDVLGVSGHNHARQAERRGMPASLTGSEAGSRHDDAASSSLGLGSLLVMPAPPPPTGLHVGDAAAARRRSEPVQPAPRRSRRSLQRLATARDADADAAPPRAPAPAPSPPHAAPPVPLPYPDSSPSAASALSLTSNDHFLSSSSSSAAMLPIGPSSSSSALLAPPPPRGRQWSDASHLTLTSDLTSPVPVSSSADGSEAFGGRRCDSAGPADAAPEWGHVAAFGVPGSARECGSARRGDWASSLSSTSSAPRRGGPPPRLAPAPRRAAAHGQAEPLRSPAAGPEPLAPAAAAGCRLGAGQSLLVTMGGDPMVMPGSGRGAGSIRAAVQTPSSATERTRAAQSLLSPV